MQHYCGTCIHSRVAEDLGVEHYECDLDPNKRCGWYDNPCEDYKPDVDYINFLEYERIE